MQKKYKKIYTKSPALDSGNLTLEEKRLTKESRKNANLISYKSV
jgi:hypothetical protein